MFRIVCGEFSVCWCFVFGRLTELADCARLLSEFGNVLPDAGSNPAPSAGFVYF